VNVKTILLALTQTLPTKATILRRSEGLEITRENGKRRRQNDSQNKEKKRNREKGRTQWLRGEASPNWGGLCLSASWGEKATDRLPFSLYTAPHPEFRRVGRREWELLTQLENSILQDRPII